jgi:hypothetical protein
MLWFVIALQALTPFIHAHAGVVQASHAGFLHVHQSVHGDATSHALEQGEQDVEVEVAQGMPLQHTALAVANASMPFATTSIPSPTAMASWPGAGSSVSPPLHLAPPDHTLPFALAPPVC